jgi:SAM-dependent methyltransferase
MYALLRRVYHALPLSSVLRRKLRAALGPRFQSDYASATRTFILETRRAKILAWIDPSAQEGLEIGPLCSPVVTKSDAGGRIWYVDHIPAALLREHYAAAPNVRPDEIVDVDYLWGERPLAELVEGKQFDYVIASHVVEHVPDMLGWFEEVAGVLKDNGVLSLAVPDKRYSFDILRELSTMGMLLEAHLLHRRRPGPREIFDHVAMAAKVDAGAAWGGRIAKANLEHFHDLNQALQRAESSLHCEEYVDTHVNIFTPRSFIDLLEMAARLELFGLVVRDFHDTARGNLEFFVTLERPPRKADRQDRLQRQLASFDWARKKVRS